MEPNEYLKPESLRTDGKSKALESLIRKTLAIGSGKGGVGKTITATNMAIFYARKGLRVGLADLDPLSDVATLLDLVEAEKALKDEEVDFRTSTRLEDHILGVFDHLDIIFPRAKASSEDGRWLLEKIYRRFLDELDQNYDLLIFDLPAGSSYEHNLIFLPFVSMIIVVTNPEPTAHVSAGGYIKKLLEIEPETTVHLWHNRYPGSLGDDFDPRNVAVNYNRNVSEELRLTGEEIARLNDFAFIPEDPSLNLLHGDPALVVSVQRSLLDTLEFIQEEQLAEKSKRLAVSGKLFELIKSYICRHKKIEDLDGYLRDLGAYLKSMLTSSLSGSGYLEQAERLNQAGIDLFTQDEEKRIRSFLREVQEDRFRQALLRIIGHLEEKIGELENSRRLFYQGGVVQQDKALDRELSSLLLDLNRAARSNRSMGNYGGLLLFYFALYKLFQSKSIVTLVNRFIPRRKDHQGRLVRDRHRQIMYLVQRSEEYQKRYLKLVKALYPVVSKQLSILIKTFELSNLVFRNEKQEILRKSYLMLLTNFLHDTVYSGLSVVVGFDYRAASVAFQKAAEKALAMLTRSH